MSMVGRLGYIDWGDPEDDGNYDDLNRVWGCQECSDLWDRAMGSIEALDESIDTETGNYDQSILDEVVLLSGQYADHHRKCH